MPASRNLILDHAQAMRKIRRIAYEIYEQNFEENEVVFIGVHQTGFLFAQTLQQEVKKIAPFKTALFELKINKQEPVNSAIELAAGADLLANKVLVLTDDVLNTGSTLVYSMRPLLDIAIKKLQLAVMVDREHRSFPVSPDFVGYALSTTVNQHIEVSINEGGEIAVYLD